MAILHTNIMILISHASTQLMQATQFEQYILLLTCCYCCCCCCYHICEPSAQWPVSLFILDAHPDSATDTGRIAHNSALTCRVSAPGCRPWSRSDFFLSPSLSEKTPRSWEDGAWCRHRDGGAPTSDRCRVRVTVFCCLIPPTRGVNTQMVLGYGPGRLVSGGVQSTCVTARGTATGHCLHVWPERDPARADPHHRPTMSSPPPAAEPVMADGCNFNLCCKTSGSEGRLEGRTKTLRNGEARVTGRGRGAVTGSMGWVVTMYNPQCDTW